MPYAYTVKSKKKWLFDGEKNKIAVIVLKNGKYKIGIRKLQNDPAIGVVKLRLVGIIKDIGSSEKLIDADSPVAYRIVSSKKQKYALGAISDKITPDCILLDASGLVVAQGPAVFPELKKGIYTLVYLSEKTGIFRPVIIAASDLDKRVTDDKIKAFLKKHGFKK